MGRGIKILLKCTLCKRLKYHTAYHRRARGFVCGRCGEWLEKNPTYKNQPFKGWGFWPTKEEQNVPERA